jgi:hypothetical protein
VSTLNRSWSKGRTLANATPAVCAAKRQGRSARTHMPRARRYSPWEHKFEDEKAFEPRSSEAS